jgi:hypothetical protein
MWEVIAAILSALIPIIGYLIKSKIDSDHEKKILEENQKKNKEAEDRAKQEWLDHQRRVNEAIERQRKAEEKWKSELL